MSEHHRSPRGQAHGHTIHFAELDEFAYSSHNEDDNSLMGTSARRRPFLNPRDREETARTRKYVACMRCRSQKLRVSTVSSF
jgi:hypothetical protein